MVISLSSLEHLQLKLFSSRQHGDLDMMKKEDSFLLLFACLLVCLLVWLLASCVSGSMFVCFWRFFASGFCWRPRSPILRTKKPRAGESHHWRPSDDRPRAAEKLTTGNIVYPCRRSISMSRLVVWWPGTKFLRHHGRCGTHWIVPLHLRRCPDWCGVT